jgi:exosortase/archaeosortase family protein
VARKKKAKPTSKKTGPEIPEKVTKPDVPEKGSKETGKEVNKPTLKEYIKRLMPLIKAFALWFILISLVQIPGFKETFRDWIVGLTTASTVVVGKALFIPIVRTGFENIQVNGFNMEIIVECTAYNFYLFAIALSLFADWRWKNKAINLLIFFGVIFFVNNLRFFAMGYVGRYYPELFDSTHDYVWNILFGFMIFGVWAWRDGKNNIHLKALKAKKNEA